MTVAGGTVITQRMLDVLSSGGETNGQALAQGPYLKILKDTMGRRRGLPRPGEGTMG